MSLLTDLVAYWKLDESSGTRADSHGLLDLAEAGTVGSVSGVVGSAASGFGTSDYLSRAKADFLIPAGGVLTVACWVNIASASDGHICGIRHAYPDSIQWVVQSASGNFRVYVRGDGGSDDIAAVAATLDEWVFLVAEIDAGAGTLSIQANDGTPGTGLWSGSAADPGVSAVFSVGCPTLNPSVLDGSVDELGVWTRALTSGERTSLYNSGAGLAYPFSPPPISATATNTLTLTQSVNVTVRHDLAVSDTLVLTQSAAYTARFDRLAQNALVLTSTGVGHLFDYSIATNTLTLSQSVENTVRHDRDANNTLTISQSVDCDSTLIRAASNTLTLTQSADCVVYHSRTASNVLNLTQNSIGSLDDLSMASNTLSLNQTVQCAARFNRSTSSSLILTQVVSVRLIASRTASNVLAFTQEASGIAEVGDIFDVECSNTLSLTQSASGRLTIDKSVSNALILTQSVFGTTETMPIFIRGAQSNLTLVQDVDVQLVRTLNIYGTLEKADVYFGSLLHGQRWLYSDVTRKRQALNEATQRIDCLSFIGVMASASQPLQFPRGTDTLVPVAIERACYEVALAILSGVDPDTERDNLSVTVQAYGGLRTEYDRTGVPAHYAAGIPSATAWQYLLPFLEPQLGIHNNRVS